MKFLFFSLLICTSIGLRAQAIDLEADDSYADLKNGTLDAVGSVQIKFEDQIVTADKISINKKTGQISIPGKGLLKVKDHTIEAESLDWSLKKGVGKFKNAIVRVKDSLYFEGREIERVSKDRYLIKDGKLSPCLNCPQSWSLVGKYIDVTVGKIAYIHHVFFQVKDQPVMYFPYLFYPIGVERKTGFLIPEFRSSKILGPQIRIPFFWALTEHQDLLLSGQYFTEAGYRFKADYRYLYSSRSQVFASLSYLRNNNLNLVETDRYAIDLELKNQLTSHLALKMKNQIRSDVFYDYHFEDEIRSAYWPKLDNSLGLEWTGKSSYGFAKAHFYQDALLRDPGQVESLGYRGEVNKLPDLSYYFPSIELFDNLYLRTQVASSYFSRGGEELDTFTASSMPSSWIRSGLRTSALSELKYHIPIWESLSFESDFSLRVDWYRFFVQSLKDNAHRVKSRFRNKLEATFWKNYTVEAKKESRQYRHEMRPTVEWFYSDRDYLSDHIFFNQVARNGFKAPLFDLYDPGTEESLDFNLKSTFDEKTLRRHNFLLVSWNHTFFKSVKEQNVPFLKLDLGYINDFNQKSDNRFFMNSYFNYFKWLTIWGHLTYADFSNNLQYDLGMGFAYFNWWNIKVSQRKGSLSNRFYVEASASIRLLNDLKLSAYGEYSEDQDKWLKQGAGIFYLSPAKCWGFGLDVVKDLSNIEYMPLIKITYQESVKTTKNEFKAN